MLFANDRNLIQPFKRSWIVCCWHSGNVGLLSKNRDDRLNSPGCRKYDSMGQTFFRRDRLRWDGYGDRAGTG
jgi:hypothetical protein